MRGLDQGRVQFLSILTTTKFLSAARLCRADGTVIKGLSQLAPESKVHTRHDLRRTREWRLLRARHCHTLALLPAFPKHRSGWARPLPGPRIGIPHLCCGTPGGPSASPSLGSHSLLL